MSEPVRLSKLRLNRPLTQNLAIGALLFCLPGIYLALTGLGAGGGGPDAIMVAVQTNAIVYGLFTLSGWLSGPVLNVLGAENYIIHSPLGSIGYPLYAGGLWYFDAQKEKWFPYFGGVMLGIFAGCLWMTAGYVSFSYADEKDKGKYIAMQWAMASAGGSVGASVAFGINIRQTLSTGVPSSVYITFVSIMCTAVVFSALLLVPAEKIVRDDGTPIARFQKTNWLNEIKHFSNLLTDWKALALFPAIFVGEQCLALVSSLNAYCFTLRSRSLNNVLFQAVMIPASLLISALFDTQRIKSRRNRGILGIAFTGIVTMASCAGLLGWMKQHGFESRTGNPPGVDWTDPRYAGGLVLYLFWGVVYASYQICTQWVLASLTNDPVKCAVYSGYFKGTTSLGLCAAFLMDAYNVSYVNQLIIEFVLYGVGSSLLMFVNWFYVRDTNYFAEENVVAPTYIEKATDEKAT